MNKFNNDNILTIKNVSKSFDGNLVVKNLNLEIRTGEFMCLLGPSGCGKTTALRLIAGLEEPDNGSIYIDGELVTSGRNIKKQSQSRDIGIVFQDLSYFHTLPFLKM